MLDQLTLTDQQLLDMVERIAIESTRDGKLEALSALLATAQGRRLVDWCYNPFVTFGVTWKQRPQPLVAHDGNEELFEDVECLLRALASRRLTGNEARDAIEALAARLPQPALTLLWLCLNKDLKAGVNIATIKQAMPDLFPVFAVMRAQPYEEKRVTTFPVAVEPKLDGFRYSFVARDGSGAFFTRSGKSTPAVDFMVEPMLNTLRVWADKKLATSPVETHAMKMNLTLINGIPEVVLDGEMLAGNGFNELSGELRRTDKNAESAVFHVFDMLTWEEFDASGSVMVPYRARRGRVGEFVSVAATTPFSDRVAATSVALARSHDDIDRCFRVHRASGYEGSMVKHLDGPYDKKKSFGWMKIKPSDTEDLEVVGAYPGEPGTKYEHCLGGLTVKRPHNGGFVEVNVGGGFTDAQREELWKHWGYDGQLMNSAGRVVTSDGVGKLVGRLIEVSFHEVTPDGSLRHPVFKRFRDDKAGEVDK